MTDVWSDPYFGQGDKVKLLVALAIADCANSDSGMAWPAIESLARKSRTSIRGAQEAVREMEKDGKLEIEVGKGPHGTNLYRLYPRTECTPDSELQRTPPHSVHPAQRAPRKRAAEKAAENQPEKAALDCTQSVMNRNEPSLTEGTTNPTIPQNPAETQPPASGGAGGIVEGKNSPRTPASEQSRRIADIFHRKHTTSWSEKEIKSYKKIGTVDPDELGMVERYYAAHWPPAMGVNNLRHDLLTFLNNFPGEVGRAWAWDAEQKSPRLPLSASRNLIAARQRLDTSKELYDINSPLNPFRNVKPKTP